VGWARVGGTPEGRREAGGGWGRGRPLAAVSHWPSQLSCARSDAPQIGRIFLAWLANTNGGWLLSGHCVVGEEVWRLCLE